LSGFFYFGILLGSKNRIKVRTEVDEVDRQASPWSGAPILSHRPTYFIYS
jgi:hypothetical protein